MSGHTGPDVEKMLIGISKTMRSMLAQLDEIQTALATMNLPTRDKRPACPKCGIRTSYLDEHLRNVHDHREENDDRTIRPSSLP